jgi:hypothetical protein
MNATQAQQILDQYDARFGNLDEIAMPEIVTTDAFVQMLQTALHRDTPVTTAELQAKFPDAAFEEVAD